MSNGGWLLRQFYRVVQIWALPLETGRLVLSRRSSSVDWVANLWSPTCKLE